MKTWTVTALTPGDDWKKNRTEFFTLKRDAVRFAKRLLIEQGEQFESITIIADNSTELLDESEIRIK